jgi:rod shape-determining protein MreD
LKQFVRTTVSWILLAFVGETVFAPLMTVKGIAPDFALIALVILALAGGSFAGCVGGFVIGLVQDLATPTLLGLHALCKSGLGYALGRLRGQLVYGMPIVEGLVIVLAVLAHDTLYLLVQSRMSSEAFLQPLVVWALPRAIYTAVVGMPILRVADWLGILRRGE